MCEWRGGDGRGIEMWQLFMMVRKGELSRCTCRVSLGPGEARQLSTTSDGMEDKGIQVCIPCNVLQLSVAVACVTKCCVIVCCMACPVLM